MLPPSPQFRITSVQLCELDAPFAAAVDVESARVPMAPADSPSLTGAASPLPPSAHTLIGRAQTQLRGREVAPSQAAAAGVASHWVGITAEQAHTLMAAQAAAGYGVCVWVCVCVCVCVLACVTLPVCVCVLLCGFVRVWCERVLVCAVVCVLIRFCARSQGQGAAVPVCV